MKTRKISIVIIILLLTAIFFNIEAVNATSEKYTITKLASSASILDKTIDDGDTFLNAATNKTDFGEGTRKITDDIYGLLMLIGMAIAVIIGLIIGLKYMMTTVDEKAATKKQLVVYFIGCAVLFGALTIWKTAATFLNNVF